MAEPHFAVALTFSPRFRSVLAESDLVARAHGARLSVLHAAARSDEKVARFHQAFAELGRHEVDIYWCDGETPGEALLDAAASEFFDLIIAGAMEHAPELRNFTGDIARELMLKAPGNLLLLPNPEDPPRPLQKVCLMVEAHRPKWKYALRALEALKPASISILAADSPFAHATVAALGHEQEHTDLDEVVAAAEAIAEETDLRRVQSNTGFTLCEIVQHDAPDVILVEAEWVEGRRNLPRHLDWLRQVVPSRLYIVGKPPA